MTTRTEFRERGDANRTKTEKLLSREENYQQLLDYSGPISDAVDAYKDETSHQEVGKGGFGIDNIRVVEERRLSSSSMRYYAQDTLDEFYEYVKKEFHKIQLAYQTYRSYYELERARSAKRLRMNQHCNAVATQALLD